MDVNASRSDTGALGASSIGQGHAALCCSKLLPHPTLSQAGERSCTVFSYPTIRAEPLCGQVNYKGLDEDERKLLKENLIILQDCECSGVKFAVTLSDPEITVSENSLDVEA